MLAGLGNHIGWQEFWIGHCDAGRSRKAIEVVRHPTSMHRKAKVKDVGVVRHRLCSARPPNWKLM